MVTWSTEWGDLLHEVSAVQREAFERGSETWFRGQGAARWGIRSSMHRHILAFLEESGQPLSEKEQADLLYLECKALYHHFKADAWPLLEERERHPWGIVFAMRHHGVPTRLIDWTQSFAVALYFSLEARPEGETPVVFALDPQRLNGITAGVDGLIALDTSHEAATFDTDPWHPATVPVVGQDLRTIAVSPILTSRRMVAQRSAFLLSGDAFEPVERQCDGRLEADGVLRRFEIGPDVEASAREFLTLVGIDPLQLCPDLEGLRLKLAERTRRTLAQCRSFRVSGGSGLDVL